MVAPPRRRFRYDRIGSTCHVPPSPCRRNHCFHGRSGRLRHSLPHQDAIQESARYAAHAKRNYTPPGPAEDPWGPYIREASARFDMPETWVRSLMRVESGGKEYLNGDLITSGAGAMGLMQVMPGTYDELRDRYNLGDDPFDPHDNIMAGVAYMREMYEIYGSPGFLAAYNAGPARLDDYLANVRPLPDETRHYVAMIGPNLRGVYPNNRSAADETGDERAADQHSAGQALRPPGDAGGCQAGRRRPRAAARAGGGRAACRNHRGSGGVTARPAACAGYAAGAAAAPPRMAVSG